MKSTKIITLLASSVLAAIAARSETNQTATSYFDKLESNDPNYFVLAEPLSNGELDGDELHGEFYLSIKYPFRLPENNHSLQPDRVDVIYNGLYDFYLFDSGRYESAPIISRRQNPGVRLSWDLNPNSEFGLGYFHESNGQTLDREDGATAFNAEVEQGGEEYALSQVSRGWDYVSFRYHKSGREKRPWSSRLEYRYFLTRQGGGSVDTEDRIFWDPNDSSRIQDYDGLRFIYEREVPSFKWAGKSSLRLELKTGSSSLDALGHFGGQISYSFCKCLHVFYFNGYGQEPSTYHLRTDYVGFGLVFR